MSGPCGFDLAALRGAMEGVSAATLCTCDADGLPNASMISQVHWVDAERVALSYQFFNKTRANILTTGRACVSVLDVRTLGKYRLNLEYEETRTEGPLFETMRAKLAGIASHHGLEGVFRLLGSDVFRVVGVEEILPPSAAAPRRGVSLLASARALIAEILACRDFDEMSDVLLEGLIRHFGITHAMLLVAEGDGRLFAIGSRGYATSGVGAEIQSGEGVIGVAAREGVPIRIGHVSTDYRYGAALGAAALSAGLLAETPRSVPMPGLGTPHSQIAVPIRSDGAVVGVIFAEASEIMRFWHEDEDALVIVASAAGAMAAAFRSAETGESAGAVLPLPPAGDTLTVRRYARDDSVFFNHDYIIKGVAGAILWRLLTEYHASGRADFTTRELRLDAALKLPEHAENLDARLVLLRRRLEDRDAGLRIAKTGRGTYRLDVGCGIELEEIGGAPAAIAT